MSSSASRSSALTLPWVTAPGFSRGMMLVDLVVQLRRLLGRPRDDEGGPGLVDEDAVDLVDDGEAVPALHEVRELELHVVAQVVEAVLVVGAVGDVAGVGGLALRVAQVVLDDPDRHAEEPVDPAHPLRIAPGQVVVHGDDVDPAAAEGVQVGGEGGDEGLALAGLHLGDPALVQDHAADELDVEVPHVEHATACLADHREGVGQQVVQGLAPVGALAQARGSRAELGVIEAPHLGFAVVDLGQRRPHPLEVALVLGAEDFPEDVLQHRSSPGTASRAI